MISVLLSLRKRVAGKTRRENPRGKIMATLSRAEDQVVEFLRAKLTDPRSRHTADSDSFTATASQTVFTLTPTTGSHLVRAITSVTVAGSTQKK